jgi:hypothetical protein
MKRFALTFVLPLFAIALMAQVPAGFSYQAVVRNNDGEVLANQPVSFRFTILQNSPSGVPVYTETQDVTTNDFGLANLNIGRGTVVDGIFSPGGWGLASHFLKIELDVAGGSNYIPLGTLELMAVPYAFHAQTVEEDQVDDADADTTNELQELELSGTVLGLSKSSKTVTLPSSGGGDNWGTDVVHTDATLEGQGTTSLPLKIAQQSATTGQVLKWDGSTWMPGDDLSGSSLWQQSGSDIYFNSGKVGIGKIPGADLRQFQVLAGATQAITGVNNSSIYSAIFAQNNGTGPAAEFRNYIKIIDGTQGANKVLTSDDNGSASWKTGIWASDDNYIYYNSGKKLGIGITKPTRKMTIADASASCYMNIQNSTTGYTTTSGMIVGMDGNNGWLTTYEPGTLYLGTNGVSRIAIASDGDVGIGISNPTQKLDINGALNIMGNGSLDIFCDSKEALWFNGTYFSWGYGGEYNYFGDEVTIGTSAVPGYTLVVNGTAAKTGGGSWSTLSDIRLKDLRGNYLKGLNEILQLNPVIFTYKPGNPRELDSNSEQIGFVAQDVQKIFPEAVNLCNDGYLDFNIHSINVALVNAVKELKAENDRLKSRLDKIESMVGGTAEK